MVDLLKEKLREVNDFKKFTKEILSLSLKTEYDKVNNMFDERERFIKNINNIDEKINEFIKDNKVIETREIKLLKAEIKEVFKEIISLDTLIRQNINNELKNVKKNLNQPETLSKSLNIKA